MPDQRLAQPWLPFGVGEELAPGRTAVHLRDLRRPRRVEGLAGDGVDALARGEVRRRDQPPRRQLGRRREHVPGALGDLVGRSCRRTDHAEPDSIADHQRRETERGEAPCNLRQRGHAFGEGCPGSLWQPPGDGCSRLDAVPDDRRDQREQSHERDQREDAQLHRQQHADVGRGEGPHERRSGTAGQDHQQRREDEESEPEPRRQL